MDVLLFAYGAAADLMAWDRTGCPEVKMPAADVEVRRGYWSSDPESP